MRILENELKIIEETNLKFKQENENLKNELNNLNSKVLDLNSTILSQKTISQFDIDNDELQFLDNLEHGHKCRKSFFNSKGHVVGSTEYKNCILNKGKE